MRPEIQRFAEAMEAKMAAKDEQYGDSWKRMWSAQLYARLQDEVYELLKSLRAEDVEGITGEAVDVANIAMMIHENAGGTPNE